MKNDVERFAEGLMAEIKSDFMYRAKSGRTNYSMEEVLWIVHENIEEALVFANKVDKLSKPLELKDPDPYDSTLGYTLKDVEESFNRVAEYYRNEVQDGE